MDIVFALLPILVILLLLFVLKQSAIRAGFASYAVALLIALFVPAYRITGGQLVHSTIKGALTASIVAYVLLFGIILFHLMNEMGVIKSIASFVASSTSDPVRQVLILCVAFSPLVESASGFGIAIIVTAPILVSLGFSRSKATMLSLLSLSAVPWGALATGTVIGSNIAGIPLSTIGAGTALLCLPTFFFFSLLAVVIAGGWRGLAAKWAEWLVLVACLSGSVFVFSKYVSTELAGVLGALVAIGVELVFIRMASKNAKKAMGTSASQVSAAAAEQAPFGIVKALSPYLFLTALLFLTHLIKPIANWLNNHVAIDLPSFGYHLPILYSPGFALFLACVFTVLLFSIKKDVMKTAYHKTMKQWIPVNVSTFGYVAMSEIMSASGMTSSLAQAAALTFGASFMFLCPLIGGLGGFLTGSNTGSNAMFIKLQTQVAGQLGISPDLFAFGQTASASHLTMASPSRVLLGVSVTEIHQEENSMIRKMSLISLGTLVLLMIGLFVLYQFYK